MVQLVTTMAIFAVVAAVSTPLYDSFLSSRRIDEAVRRLVDDLRFAQSSAIAKGGLFRFRSGSDPTVNMPGNYRIERSTDGGANWTAVTPWDSIASEFQGVSFTTVRDSSASPQTLYEARFDSRGACVNCTGPNTPPIVITISRGSTVRTARVRITGSIYVQ